MKRVIKRIIGWTLLLIVAVGFPVYGLMSDDVIMKFFGALFISTYVLVGIVYVVLWSFED